MSFVPVGCAVRPCSRRVLGMDLVHPSSAVEGWIWAGIALLFRAQGRAAE